MKVFRSVDEFREWRRSLDSSRCVGFTPTMGGLHDGHLAHITALNEITETTVCSIFVNPTQFAPNEDFSSYPRTLEADAERLAGIGCTALLAPTAEQIYPDGFATSVAVAGLTEVFEGERRPTHFRGVTTVVAKLLNIVAPRWLTLGQKDAQQLAVLRRMIADLDLPVDVVAVPIIRDPDGLAMSSRNRFLPPERRADALLLSKALGRGRQLWIEGVPRERVEAQMTAALSVGTELDYCAIVNAATFLPSDQHDPAAIGIVAATVGGVRLIDNLDFSVTRA